MTPPTLPARIGPYRILDRLGEGGMGVVYRGAHQADGTPVAIKTARLAEQNLPNLRAEIRALARLHDPGIVRILDSGAEGGLPWFAMEFIEGRTWQELNDDLWASRKGSTTTAPTDTQDLGSLGTPTTTLRLDVPDEAPTRPLQAVPAPEERPRVAGGRLVEVLTLAWKLCRPLGLLHGEGVVHRDLKPANVVVRPDGTPVLVDLGVISRFQGAASREKAEAGGSVVGTLTYIAPEQARGLRVDARADLYSFGAMLFESLSGRPPIESDTVQGMLQRVAHEPPPALSSRVVGAPPRLDALLARMLAKDPEERVGYADDVADELAAILTELGAPVERPASRGRGYLYRPRLVGRAPALAALQQRLKALSEGRGGLVFVAGESGVGKTFLASEVARQARARGTRVIVGECVPVGPGENSGAEFAGAPLHPLRPFFQTVADRCRFGGTEVTGALLGPAGAVLVPYEPALDRLPGAETWPTPPAVTPEVARARLLDATRDAVAAWTRREGALLLLLDDLQWADGTTLEWLSTLDRTWLDAHRVLILGTFRADEADATLRALADPSRRLDLPRLDAGEVRWMVSDMLGLSDPPERLVGAIARLSEGNPFLVAEYLRVAAAEGVLERRAGRWHLAPAHADRLPEPRSVQELVARRIEGIGAEGQAILEAAAAVGREFDAGLLRAVGGWDADALADVLRELEARAVVEPASDGALRFAHDRLRETCYGRIEPARRKALHRGIAEALEAREPRPGEARPWAVLARHWREAGEPAKAVDHLERAGAEARRTWSNREAIGAYTEAIELAEQSGLGIDADRRAAWERHLADASLGMGDVTGGTTHVGRALALLGQPPLPTGSAAGWALLGSIFARIAQGWMPGRFAIRDAAEASRAQLAAHLYNRLLEPLMINNQPLLGAYCGMRNINLAERVAPSPALARGYGMMAAILCISPLKGVALRWADRGMEVAERVGDRSALTYALNRGSTAYFVVGRWDVFIERFNRSLELARADGDRRWQEEARLGLSVAGAVRGRFAECIEHARLGVASAQDRGDGQVVTFCGTYLIAAAARLGLDAEAASTEALVMERSEDFIAGERLMVPAEAALAALLRGETQAARAAADRAFEAATATPPPVRLLPRAPAVRPRRGVPAARRARDPRRHPRRGRPPLAPRPDGEGAGGLRADEPLRRGARRAVARRGPAAGGQGRGGPEAHRARAGAGAHAGHGPRRGPGAGRARPPRRARRRVAAPGGRGPVLRAGGRRPRSRRGRRAPRLTVPGTPRGPAHPRLARLANRTVTRLARGAFAGLGWLDPDGPEVRELALELRRRVEGGRPAWLVGITAATHASGVALVRVERDGPVLVANHEEERFTGKKHYAGHPERSLDELGRTFARVGIGPADVHAVLAGWDYPALLGSLVGWFVQDLPETRHALHPAAAAVIPRPRVEVLPLLRARLLRAGLRAPLVPLPHHANHAWLAVSLSPFGADPAPVLVTVIDGSGDAGPLSVWLAEGGTLRPLHHEPDIQDSLGALYALVSSTQGGWPPLSSEGRYMGAAAWGDGNRATNRYYPALRGVLHLLPGGRVRVDRDGVRYARVGRPEVYGPALAEALGPPIPPERMWDPDAVLRVDDIHHAPITVDRVDKAAACQMVFEDALTHVVEHFLRSTGATRLVLSGGTALNCLATMRLSERFDRAWYRAELGREARLHLWVPPIPGDAGVAPGACWTFARGLAGLPSGPPLPHAFWCGEAPTAEAVRRALEADREAGAWLVGPVDRPAGRERVADLLAFLVCSGAVVGLYQGAAETGPRALGHRSILADPRNPEARELLNARVKHREAIRPLAPMATLEAARALFELSEGALDLDAHAYAWMVLTARARPGTRERVPAVIHHDGTARVQVVRPGADPLTHAYLRAMGRRAGVEVSVNTSLNVGAPIAQTPEQALATLHRSRGMDALLLVGGERAWLAWRRGTEAERRLHDWRLAWETALR